MFLIMYISSALPIPTLSHHMFSSYRKEYGKMKREQFLTESTDYLMPLHQRGVYYITTFLT